MDYTCKVSIIIPVYNMENYLEHNVACWTAQTLHNIEIIYVNDGSTDDSLRILEKKAQADNRIQVYSFSTNKGPWAARNYGVEKATGQYILFADADDTVLEETCDELSKAMDEAKVDILQYNVDVINTNNPQKQYDSIKLWLKPYKGIHCGEKKAFTLCFQERKYSWNLCGKIFKTEICKEVLSNIVETDIQDKYILIAEDALLYFMLSYSAQSYKGCSESKNYYQYFRGRGGSGHYTCTMPYFIELCRQSQILSIMSSFLERKSTLSKYKDVISIIRDSFLTNTVRQWSNLSDTDKSLGFDIMIKSWCSDEVINKLAEIYANDISSLATALQNASTLNYDGHKLNTIAIYSDSIADGGAERVLCLLCNIWLNMGYKVFVLTNKPPCERDYTLPPDIKRIVLSENNSYLANNFYHRIQVLINVIKNYNIDAVVYNCEFDSMMLWDTLAIKSSGAAFLIHCHSIFSYTIFNGWNNIANMVSVYKLADAMITLCSTSKSFLQYYNSNVHVTLNPIIEGLDSIIPIKYQSNHRILWLARLVSIKNPLDTIAIMQEVIKSVPDAVLTIVGKSVDGSIEKQLNEQITRLNLKKHIILAGFQKDVPHWYHSSQIFLMTSSIEGWSMTLQESKIAGIPCVMYELPYLTLCEGNRGIIPVPQRNTSRAAQAIIKLLQDDNLCSQYGRDARAHIEELARFNFNKKWRDIFESLEYTHKPIVSKTDQLMMDTLIEHYEKSLRDAKVVRDEEIRRLKTRPEHYIKRVAKTLIPERLKPLIKTILRYIPPSIKQSIKHIIRHANKLKRFKQ